MTSPLRRRIAGVLLFAAVACIVGVGARASSASTPATQAARLAGRASAAGSASARYQAVLDIARSLGLPVFTATGKQVASRATSLPASFNLYDFQLGATAAALSRHDSLTIAGLAQLYAQAGARITAATLASRLHAGIRAAAAKPAAPASELGLIVRDLGLHHHPAADLAGTATPATKLDPLQALLIAADSALHSRGGRTLAAASSGARLLGPCDGSTQPGGAPAAVTGAGSGDGAGLMQVMLLIQSTEITVVNTPLRETHYGPAGHAAYAGQTMRLGVHVAIKYKLPKDVLCGMLAGRRFPSEGPAVGYSIFWRVGDLLQYGSIDFDPADMKTGADGNSTLVFKPKSENVPNFGSEVKATGQVSATSGGPSTATAGLLTVSQGWTVTYHKPRGFKFTMPAITFTNTAPDGTKTVLPVSITGRVCGDDPYTVPWTINESIKGIPANYDVTLPEGLPITTGQIGDFPHEWRLVDRGNGDLEVSVKITPGAPFSGTFDPPSASTQARVVEDKSCPDNSDSG